MNSASDCNPRPRHYERLHYLGSLQFLLNRQRPRDNGVKFEELAWRRVGGHWLIANTIKDGDSRAFTRTHRLSYLCTGSPVGRYLLSMVLQHKINTGEILLIVEQFPGLVQIYEILIRDTYVNCALSHADLDTARREELYHAVSRSRKSLKIMILLFDVSAHRSISARHVTWSYSRCWEEMQLQRCKQGAVSRE